LAQVKDAQDLLDTGIRGGGFSDTTDSLIVLGFILLLATALFSWAYFLRKRPVENLGSHVLVRPSSRRSRHASSRRADPSGSTETETTRRMRVRKRRRAEELRRNPTLDETGGLPPLRPEEPDGPTPAASS
jgi:hypothetical protein